MNGKLQKMFLLLSFVVVGAKKSRGGVNINRTGRNKLYEDSKIDSICTSDHFTPTKNIDDSISSVYTVGQFCRIEVSSEECGLGNVAMFSIDEPNPLECQTRNMIEKITITKTANNWTEGDTYYVINSCFARVYPKNAEYSIDEVICKKGACTLCSFGMSYQYGNGTEGYTSAPSSSTAVSIVGFFAFSAFPATFLYLLYRQFNEPQKKV